MDEEKHTPGPWFTFNDGLCVGGPFTPSEGDNPDQKTAGIAMCGMRLRHNKEAEANARLIAAAPDLLAALKESKHYVCLGSADSVRTTREGRRKADEVLGRLLAAIEKATGES